MECSTQVGNTYECTILCSSPNDDSDCFANFTLLLRDFVFLEVSFLFDKRQAISVHCYWISFFWYQMRKLCQLSLLLVKKYLYSWKIQLGIIFLCVKCIIMICAFIVKKAFYWKFLVWYILVMILPSPAPPRSSPLTHPPKSLPFLSLIKI